MYTGITKQQLEKRLSQHNYSGKGFSNLVEKYNGLSRNQARALEQHFIKNGPNKMNQISSIARKHRFYQQSQEWARSYIKVYDR